MSYKPFLYAEAPVFIPDKYDDHGKWMDGWESRRRRVKGHDYAVIRLGRPGKISGFEVDTTHFTGNFPPFCSVEAAYSPEAIPEEKDWRELVAKTALNGDHKHYFRVVCSDNFTHVRLNIYPDGGVARLRVYGQVSADWHEFDRARTIDLAALEWGGRALYANDAHFGAPENLIAPGRGLNMGDGWETRRNPGRGTDPAYWTQAHDCCILALAHKGVIEKVVLDTAYFKGNYPDRASIQAADCSGQSEGAIQVGSKDWPEILPVQKLEADKIHEFALRAGWAVTHVRLNIYPDGGVSRLRLFGRVTD